jgi:hypothetical protein
LEEFFLPGDCGVLPGVLAKSGGKTWRFRGEFVVDVW